MQVLPQDATQLFLKFQAFYIFTPFLFFFIVPQIHSPFLITGQITAYRKFDKLQHTENF